MIETITFVVWWERGKAAAESHRFEDWDAAKEFFEGVTADPKTHKARLLQITEKEVRSFEHEGVAAGSTHC